MSPGAAVAQCREVLGYDTRHDPFGRTWEAIGARSRRWFLCGLKLEKVYSSRASWQSIAPEHRAQLRRDFVAAAGIPMRPAVTQ